MTVRFRLFRPEDARVIDVQPSQWVQAGIDARKMPIDQARDLARRGEAWTAFAVTDARILCCAGIVETFPGRQGNAWSMLATNLGVRAHLAITRFARARIAAAKLVRVECMIEDDDADRGSKWASAVGLTREATLECWGGASETIHVHSRLRRELLSCRQ